VCFKTSLRAKTLNPHPSTAQVAGRAVGKETSDLPEAAGRAIRECLHSTVTATCARDGLTCRV
jgi:hypothetical protein